MANTRQDNNPNRFPAPVPGKVGTEYGGVSVNEVRYYINLADFMRLCYWTGDDNPMYSMRWSCIYLPPKQGRWKTYTKAHGERILAGLKELGFTRVSLEEAGHGKRQARQSQPVPG